MQSLSKDNLPSHLWLLALAAFGGILITFGSTLVGMDRLAFRDISHFYYPLWVYLQQLSAVRWFPLWNPLDGFGVPIAGETTTAIFYPLRVVFFLIPNTNIAASVFVLLHLLIAGLGTRKLSLVAGTSPFAASLAGITFAASGPVFFLYTNPPFLCGAAWLPWLVLTYFRLCQQTRWPTIFSASLPTALTILAGDPQVVIHCLLIVCSTVAFLVLKRQLVAHFQYKKSNQQWIGEVDSPLRILLRLGMSLFIAAAIAAPQLAASLEWSRYSWRQATHPKSIIEQWLPKGPTNENRNVLINELKQPWLGHERDIYQFSIAPWHIFEFVTPLISGTTFPQNTRMTNAIPGETRMWYPTLYCGLLTLSMFAVGFLPRTQRTRWFWLALLSFAFALGDFGIYSWLVNLVPGYSQFRYPAKWMPMVALCMIVFSAQAFSHRHQYFVFIKQWYLIVQAICLFGLVASYLPGFEQFIGKTVAERIPPDRFSGPFAPDAALNQLRLSLGFTTILAFLQSQWFCRDNRGPLSSNRIQHLFAALGACSMCIDPMVVANWQLHTVSAIAPTIQQSMSQFPKRYLRQSNSDLWPAEWQESSDPQRWEDVERVTYKQHFMRWHIHDQFNVVNSPIAIHSLDSEWLWILYKEKQRSLSTSQQQHLQQRLMDRFGIEGLLADRTPTSNSPIQPSSQDDVVRWYDRWSTVTWDPSFPVPEIRTLLDQLASEAADAPPIIYLDNHANSSENPPLPPASTKDSHNPATINLLSYEPMEWQFKVRSENRGLLRMTQYQDGNWWGYYRSNESEDWKPTPVFKVDIFSQGIVLPAGDHELTVRYEPRWFVPSLVLALSTAAFAVTVVTLTKST